MEHLNKNYQLDRVSQSLNSQIHLARIFEKNPSKGPFPQGYKAFFMATKSIEPAIFAFRRVSDGVA